MSIPSKQEIKEWRSGHVTKYVLDRLRVYRQELLEEALHQGVDIRGRTLDKILGVEAAFRFMDELHKEGE
jgi:hypothetical protein